MKVAQRNPVLFGDAGQREIWLAQVRFDVSFYRAQACAAHALLVGGLPFGFAANRQGEKVHELLAEFGSGLRVERRALRGQGGAELDGYAAKTAAQAEFGDKRRVRGRGFTCSA